jgi:hypothetical protein
MRRVPAIATSRAIALAAVVAGLASVVVFLIAWFTSGHLPGDAVTYAAAGERLNAGHEIYRLLPGDSPVLMEPPYPPVPLLSPPLIAVVFRPLALLPGLAGAWLWFATMATLLAVAVAVLLRAAPVITGLALVTLSFPVAVLIGVGNVDALVISGGVSAWLLLRQRRDASAGALIATLASLKLTPLILAWWLVAQDRRRALGAFALTGLVLAVITVAGSSLDVFGDYLGVVGAATGVAPGGFSLAGVARAAGMPIEVAVLLPRLAIALGLVLVVALRSRPGWAWAVAGLLLWLGSPAAATHTPALALVALAPLADRLPPGNPFRRAPVPGQTSDDAQ